MVEETRRNYKRLERHEETMRLKRLEETKETRRD